MDQASKNRIELEKQSLIADLEQAVETLRCNAERIQHLEKSWGESEWYLGEAKARNQRLEDELREKDYYIRRIDAERVLLREHYEEFKRLIEVEKGKCVQLEISLEVSTSKCLELEKQLEQLKMHVRRDQ